MLRSLLVRWWRRRWLDPDFPRPSQGTRTPPGLSSLRRLASGFACPYLHPATFLLHPGCGPDGSRHLRNHDPWSTSDYASDRPSWPSWTFRPSSRTSSCRTCSCSSSFYAFYWAKKHLSSPRAFEDFFRGPRPLLSPLRHRPVWTLLLFRRRHKTLGPSLKDLHQRWLLDGRRSLWRTWETVGNSL